MTVAASELITEKVVSEGLPLVIPFGFKATSPQHVIVYVGNEDGTESKLTYGTEYTVSLSETGGSVTLTNVVPAGRIVVVTRYTTKNQTVDLENQGAFFAEDHESEFDKLTLITQELQSQVDRAVKVVNVSSENPDEFVDTLLTGKYEAEKLLEHTAEIDTVADNIGAVNTVASNQTSTNTVAQNIGQVVTIGNEAAQNQQSTFYALSEAERIRRENMDWANSIKIIDGKVCITFEQ